MPDGPWPGTGAVLAAIENATGSTAAQIVGKPEPTMYDAARDRLGAGRILAVGDRLESTSPARAAPAWTPRSCSPAARRREQADAADPKPTHVADSLAALWCSRAAARSQSARAS